MRKERTLQGICLACKEEGSFVPLARTNQEEIRSMVRIAQMDLASAKELAKIASPESDMWNALYKLYYDVLHLLAEAFVRFDKIKARTHECLFAHLCEEHPELELHWDFLERIRTKRNGTLYYSRPVTYQDWKETNLQMELYINTLNEAIKEKLDQAVA